jgi:hypothetical protein
VVSNDLVRPRRAAAGIVLAGAAVAVTLGVLGSLAGGPRELPVFIFSSTQSLKAWLASGVAALVVVQLVSALWMYGKLPGVRAAPRGVAIVHRVSGVLAFLVSLPVAIYCLYGFGFDASTPRTLAYSVAGCLFYGAFTSKMLALRAPRLPGWAVPVLGGTVFTLFVLVWALSALWWFQLTGLAL